MQIETIELDRIFVDPAMVSGREAPGVNADYLATLVDALDKGDTLPPLRVTRVANGERPFWSDDAPHTQIAHATRHAKMTQDQARFDFATTNYPAYGEYALYDGHSVYAALRQRCDKHVCEVRDDEVSDYRQLRLLHLKTNFTNGQQLTDADKRRSFEVLWLGTKPDKHTRWVSERGSMTPEEIGDLLGQSRSWVTMMQAYCMVTHATGIDLGIAKANQLGRLDRDGWRAFVWQGEGLRLHVLGEELLTITPSISVAKLKALVDRELARPAASGLNLPSLPSALPSGLRLVDLPHFDGQLPLDFDEPVTDWPGVHRWVMRTAEIADQVSPEQAAELLHEIGPVATLAWKLRHRLEAVIKLAPAETQQADQSIDQAEAATA